MDEKISREQYRVRTYGGPQGRPLMPCLSGAPASGKLAESGLPITTDRYIIQFDADAFYAQVEETRNPRLKNIPLEIEHASYHSAVAQKYLIVTCNQAARRLGVTKLQGVTEAKQQVPSLVLVNGEDLTPYRQASKRIFSVLARFGVAERLGMDEVFVDVTAEVKARMQRGFLCSTFNGHIHTAGVALKQETKHRPMDLRAARSAFGELAPGAVSYESAGLAAPWEVPLKVASHIAAEARAAVKAETGFRTSAGISCSKMLAKLVSGIHKPDDQTVMLPCHAAAFVATLPVRAIPGVGWKMDQGLTAMGVTSASDLRSIPLATLTKTFGERTAKYMYLACHGEDTTPVVQSGAPKSMTVEDSFKSCTTFPAALHVLQILAPDLIARLHEDYEEHTRRPGTMTLKWRQKKQGWSRSSASILMPVQWQATKEQQADALVQASMSILRKNLAQPFSLTLLNIGATNFSAPAAMQSGVPNAFKSLFGGRAAQRNSNGAQQGTAALAGEDSRVAAKVAISARRDYGARPKGQPLAKSHERALTEAGRTCPAASSAGSDSLSDDLASLEEDDWGLNTAMGPDPLMGPAYAASNLDASEALGREHSRAMAWIPERANGQGDSSHAADGGEQNAHADASIEALQGQHAAAAGMMLDASSAAVHWGHSSQHHGQSHLSAAPEALCDPTQSEALAAKDARAASWNHEQQALQGTHSTAPASVTKQQRLLDVEQHGAGPANGLSAPDSQIAQEAQHQSRASAVVARSTIRGPEQNAGSAKAAGASTQGEVRRCAEQATAALACKSSDTGVSLSELQKLQAMSEDGQRPAPNWALGDSDELSANLRLAKRLQQEELRWHQIHSRAEAGKRKLKREGTLDAFFKKPAR